MKALSALTALSRFPGLIDRQLSCCPVCS
jgi:hypothetical protein